MVGAMTITTTFLSPYIIKIGWRISNMVVRVDKVSEKKDPNDHE